MSSQLIAGKLNASSVTPLREDSLEGLYLVSLGL